jgi:hypothetical protein
MESFGTVLWSVYTHLATTFLYEVLLRTFIPSGAIG